MPPLLVTDAPPEASSRARTWLSSLTAWLYVSLLSSSRSSGEYREDWTVEMDGRLRASGAGGGACCCCCCGCCCCCCCCCSQARWFCWFCGCRCGGYCCVCRWEWGSIEHECRWDVSERDGEVDATVSWVTGLEVSLLAAFGYEHVNLKPPLSRSTCGEEGRNGRHRGAHATPCSMHGGHGKRTR